MGRQNDLYKPTVREPVREVRLNIFGERRINSSDRIMVTESRPPAGDERAKLDPDANDPWRAIWP